MNQLNIIIKQLFRQDMFGNNCGFDLCRYYNNYRKVSLFSLRVNTPLLAALLLEISFVEIPRSVLRGVSFLSSNLQPATSIMLLIFFLYPLTFFLSFHPPFPQKL
jgi:hypothetical protein